MTAKTELEAAYSLKQSPALLGELAQVEKKLGHAKEAIELYQRYLAAGELDSLERAQVKHEIAELRGDTAPPPAPVASPATPMPSPLMPQVRWETRSDRGLVAGGISLLSAGYVGAVITGSIYLDTADQQTSYSGSSYSGPSTAAAGTLLIPVAGPLVSALCYPHASWSLPWALVDGAAQVGGLAMLIVGARTKHKVPVIDKVNFAPWASSTGGGMMVAGRF